MAAAGQDSAAARALLRRRAETRRRDLSKGAARTLPYPILAVNSEAVKLFLAVQTQWRYAGDPPAHTGLDYAAISASMDMLGIRRKARPDLLRRLQVIEIEASCCLARHRSAAIDRSRREARQRQQTQKQSGGTKPRGRGR